MNNITEDKRVLLLDNDYASVWGYPELKIAHHKFKTFIYGDHFRNTLNTAADFFEKNQCTKYLSDDRLNTTVKQEDMNWAVNDWNPRVLKCGWKFWAIVMPDKVIGKLNMKRVIENYKNLNLEIEIFDDDEEALKWLMNK